MTLPSWPLCSAAFDTIDHNILITRLSSLFSIHGSDLWWFNFYLSSRSFLDPCILPMWCSPTLCYRPSSFRHVRYPSQYSSFSFPFTFVTFAVSVPLLPNFTFYYHKLYAALLLFPLTQLYFSSSKRTTRLQRIFSWMTANLLTLSSFKTEFLLIGLKNQLAIIHNAARYLCFYKIYISFQSLLLSHSSTLLYPASPRFVNCLYYCNLLPLSFTPNLITVILPKCQLSHLQQIQNSLARTIVNAPKSCHITPILCSLHWLRIPERI